MGFPAATGLLPGARQALHLLAGNLHFLDFIMTGVPIWALFSASEGLPWRPLGVGSQALIGGRVDPCRCTSGSLIFPSFTGRSLPNISIPRSPKRGRKTTDNWIKFEPVLSHLPIAEAISTQVAGKV